MIGNPDPLFISGMYVLDAGLKFTNREAISMSCSSNLASGYHLPSGNFLVLSLSKFPTLGLPISRSRRPKALTSFNLHMSLAMQPLVVALPTPEEVEMATNILSDFAPGTRCVVELNNGIVVKYGTNIDLDEAVCRSSEMTAFSTTFKK